MAADTKNCKHCMTVIARKAKLCPQCHQPVSFIAAVKGFFKTGGWVVTSCIAGWYGLAEHAEKVGMKDQVAAAQATLETRSRELVAANFTKEALKKRWNQLASMTGYSSGNYGSTAQYNTGNVGAASPDDPSGRMAYSPVPETYGPDPAELERLQNELDEAMKAEPFDVRRVERLTEQIVAAEFGG